MAGYTAKRRSQTAAAYYDYVCTLAEMKPPRHDESQIFSILRSIQAETDCFIASLRRQPADRLGRGGAHREGGPPGRADLGLPLRRERFPPDQAGTQRHHAVPGRHEVGAAEGHQLRRRAAVLRARRHGRGGPHLQPRQGVVLVAR
ncbi:monooxygenase, FAD-binding [Actinokineospora spheciospongiae]|uniref:Monooxygenase, FAD-binding n=1 Tax=Actinokineospora spheciospongiae TaxID=909613 RepID=W7IS36_9PSEU|nr:monooxygenase, FAD-binding [Actinokineospora spheciospongiae]